MNHYTDQRATVPNTVSRTLATENCAFLNVVAQNGKLLLDAEHNLSQDIRLALQEQTARNFSPSGWVLNGDKLPQEDFAFTNDPNAFFLKDLDVLIAGMPLKVTKTKSTFDNLIQLPAASIYDGTPTSAKRTDFVFLEVWKALVAPAVKAQATIEVLAEANIGDVINVGGGALTAADVAGVDTFVRSSNLYIQAQNIVTAINDSSNAINSKCAAKLTGTTVRLFARDSGVAGNSLLLTATAPTFSVSGPSFTGGEDRPNRPDQNHIYYQGNVDSDASTWINDECVDPVLNTETAQRVQLQYRIRVVQSSDIDFRTNPDGFSSGVSPVVLAKGTANYPFVPADTTSTWLFSSALAYGRKDAGLWVAGDGSGQAAIDLNALDGFVYAIPLCFVFRHNDCSDPTAAALGFNPYSNTNGAPKSNHAGYVGYLGAIAPGVSDRPDGGFCDRITSNKVLDIRCHVCPSGVDLRAQLEVQVQALLDNKLRGWPVDIADKQTMGGTSGDVGPEYLVCNDVGRAEPDGTPPVAGDTDRGVRIRNFDHVARRFSHRPTIERLNTAIRANDRQTGPVTAPGVVDPGKYVVKAVGSNNDAWAEGDVIHFDLTNFDVTTLGGVYDLRTNGVGASSGAGLADKSFTHFAPAGTVITNVLGVYHDDGNYNTPINQEVQVKSISGLGTTHITITLDSNNAQATGGLNVAAYPIVQPVGGLVAGSPRRIFLEVEVSYPAGVGLTDLPIVGAGAATPNAALWDGTGDLGPGAIYYDRSIAPMDLHAMVQPQFFPGEQEVVLEYQVDDASSISVPSGSPIGGEELETIVSRDRLNVYFPRRLASTPTVVDEATSTTKTVLTTDVASSTRRVRVTSNLSGLGQTLCRVEYFAQDPIPNYGGVGSGFTASVYYRAVAPQTVGSMITPPGDLEFLPVMISSEIWTSFVDRYSFSQGTVFSRPLDQVPADPDFTEFMPLDSSINWGRYFSNDGLIRTPVISAVKVYDENIIATTPTKDGAYRTRYSGGLYAYQLAAASESFNYDQRAVHILPMLVRNVGASSDKFHRDGELLLAVIFKRSELDETIHLRNGSIALYRTKNRILLPDVR